MSGGRRRLAIGLLLAAALIYAVALHLPLLALGAPPADALAQVLATQGEAIVVPPPWMLPLDDAYIFIRSAQQTAQGRFLSWGKGEPSSGATSLAFTLLLLPGQVLFSSLAGWSLWSKVIGVLTLWALGLAGARLFRVLGADAPWPLAVGLALVWSGPIGWAAVGGMDNAFACAVLLLGLSLWVELAGEPRASSNGHRRKVVWLVLVVAGLPLVRPDFGALTLLASGVILAGRGPGVPRLLALTLPLPGLGLGLLDLFRTGDFRPAGAIAKSALSVPFLSFADGLKLLERQFTSILLPTYLGARSAWLPPGIGLLSVACAMVVLLAWSPGAMGESLRRRLGALLPFARRLLPLVVVWLVLVAMAPFSAFLGWQDLRHHHPGLALAWVLAFAVLYGLARYFSRRLQPDAATRPRHATSGLWRLAAILVAFLPLLNLPTYALQNRVDVVRLFNSNGIAALWLSAHGSENRDKLLLLHDAGLLRLAHPGPAIDFIGLGTPRYLRAELHGAGAVVEALAREPRLPDLVAVRPDLLGTASLIGPLFLPPRGVLGQPPLYLGRFRKEVLEHTRQTGAGVDFASLEDEARSQLVWRPPPPPLQPTQSFALAGSSGSLETNGCRPVRGRLGVALPSGFRSVSIRAAAGRGAPSQLTVYAGDRQGLGTELLPKIDLAASASGWTTVRFDLPPASSYLWLVNTASSVPWVESVRFDGGG